MNKLSDDEIIQFTKDHVFWTWSAQAKADPIIIKNAKGVYFWDRNGKRYLDFNSMTMCVNVGHGEERIINAMKSQLDELTYSAPEMSSEIRANASKLIADKTPNSELTRILFTLGGADANENAIKLARSYTNKHKILSRYRSYHGATAGAMAATGDTRRLAWEPLNMPGVVHFLDPFSYRSTFHRTNQEISEKDFSLDYINHLEEIILFEGPETIAGILLESVTGTNGIIIPPEGYLNGIRELCDKYHIVMIADEVMSGFGRTGKWFAVDHWKIVPDIMTMAKGLTSAYAPLGAVAMKPEISSSFDEVVFNSGLTYTSHPVSLAAAVANITVLEEDDLINNSAKMGKELRKQLDILQDKHQCVGDVRSIGLFAALELVKNRKTKESLSPWNSTSKEMKSFREFCLANGLFLYIHWNTVLIIPPLVINEEQIIEGCRILDKALDVTDIVCY